MVPNQCPQALNAVNLFGETNRVINWQRRELTSYVRRNCDLKTEQPEKPRKVLLGIEIACSIPSKPICFQNFVESARQNHLEGKSLTHDLIFDLTERKIFDVETATKVINSSCSAVVKDWYILKALFSGCVEPSSPFHAQLVAGFSSDFYRCDYLSELITKDNWVVANEVFKTIKDPTFRSFARLKMEDCPDLRIKEEILGLDEVPSVMGYTELAERYRQLGNTTKTEEIEDKIPSLWSAFFNYRLYPIK